TYAAALRRVADSDLGRNGRLYAVPSVPCFEIWLLLHFSYSAAPFNSADDVIRQLKMSFPDYTKEHPRSFERLADKLYAVIANAAKLEAYSRASGSENPMTQMHRLVDYLRNLRRSNTYTQTFYLQ